MLNVGQDEAEFQQAAGLHARGQVGEAEAICQRILGRNPEHAGAMHLAGILAFARGDAARGAGLIERSLAIKPQADAYSNLAEMRRQAGDLEAAVALARKSLAMDPNGATAHLHLAMALFGQRKLQEALPHAVRTAELWRESGRGQALAGVILSELGRTQEAARMLEEAARLNPSEVIVLMNLGLVYRQMGALDKAVEAHQKALALAPNHPGVWMHLGISLAMARRHEEAKVWLEKAMAACPNDAEPVQNLATLYVEMYQYERAVELCRRGLEMDPKRQLMWIAMQKAYTGMGRFAEAEEAIDKAMALGANANAYKATAHARTMAADPEGALVGAEKALEVDPGNPLFHFDRAVTLLTLGRFEEGWKEYEWRRELPEIKNGAPASGKPDWKGEDLGGKTILLYAEQGFGDAIQFMRYVPLVKARGAAKVMVACQARLKRLFSRVAGVDLCVGEGELIPGCDVKLPLMSLGGVFGTREGNVPHEAPYLSAWPEDVAWWRERVARDARGAKLKVGLSWAGRPTHLSDNLRSMVGKELLPLFGVEGVRFYSLQKGLPAEQVRPLVEAGLVDVSEEQTDFAHSAALVANLDLVISVDTAVTHLAGAMGAKTWTLLAYSADWRWGMGREESEWYPTMRLFRQKGFGDWSGVVERVRGELMGLVRG